MVSEAVKVAIITGSLSIIGIIITAIFQVITTNNKITMEFEKQAAELQRQSEVADLKLQAKLENFQAVTNANIDELSKRVEKHNSVIERAYKLEQQTAIHTEQLKVVNHRLDDLEHMGTH